MRKGLVALGLVLAVALGGGALWLADDPMAASSKEPEPQNQNESHLVDFSHWAVVLVAGDYRAHSGAPSKVFDNGRHDLAQAFAKIGFAPANMVQFSVDYDEGTQHSGVAEIASAMQTVAAKAKDGCLMYFTSHGTPQGMVIGDAILSPAQMRDMVGNACGARPTVIVMSACYSGAFVTPLQAPNRIIMTAARPDRTSFGCGEMDHYTFFDDCFLRAMPMAGDFPGLGTLVQKCVAAREVEVKATPPSEPQVSIGPNMLFTQRWRDEVPAVPGGPPVANPFNQ